MHLYTIFFLEFHHSAAETRALAIRKIPAAKKIGLTATFNRADGLSYSLCYYLGPIVITLEKSPMPCLVKMLKYTHPDQPNPKNRNGEVFFHKFYELISLDYERSLGIIKHVLNLCTMEPNRRFIMWSRYITHLVLLENILIVEYQKKYQQQQQQNQQKIKINKGEGVVAIPTSLPVFTMNIETSNDLQKKKKNKTKYVKHNPKYDGSNIIQTLPNGDEKSLLSTGFFIGNFFFF